MAQLEVHDLAQAVIDRMADCKEPRFKEVMSALLKHVHAFVQEVKEENRKKSLDETRKYMGH